MILRRSGALAFVTLMAGAACAQPAAPGAHPGGWPQGRTFLSTSVTENGQPRVLVADTRITMSFPEVGKITANAGCNTMGGAARLRGDELIVDDMWMTEMGCPGERSEQDSWLAGFLTAKPRLSLAGDELTLTGPSVTIVLADRRVADPDRPLTGTRWVVDTIYQGDTASSVPSSEPATLVLDRPGAFEATTGCAGGELRGEVALDPHSVTFTVTAQTPCIGQSNPLDAAVRAVLTGERGFEITADRLRLMAPDGTGLGLVAAG